MTEKKPLGIPPPVFWRALREWRNVVLVDYMEPIVQLPRDARPKHFDAFSCVDCWLHIALLEGWDEGDL